MFKCFKRMSLNGITKTLLLLSGLYLSSLGSCLPDWIEDSGTCYKMGTEKKTFAQALCYCAGYNSILATMSSPRKAAFIDGLLTSSMDSYILGADSQRDGNFVWHDGKPVDGSFHWRAGQPDNYENNECCLFYVHDFTSYGAPAVYDKHYGFDFRCAFQALFICETPSRGRSPIDDQFWKRRANNVKCPDNELSQHLVTTRLSCVQLCMSNCYCYSVIYNSGQRICRLYDNYFMRLSSPTFAQGDVIYE